ncbi:MAG: peptide deformylase [Patescibacteria group bacterium]
MKTILQKDEIILHRSAKMVPVKEIGSEKINQIITDMIEAMSEQKDGVAIAAPQIGISLRIFVISGDLLKKALKQDHDESQKKHKNQTGNLVFINPKIIKSSKEKKKMEEGCLSVRWLYGNVNRSTRVTLSFYNQKGEQFERGASGLLAQIFQHECDHLEGKLFIDKAEEIWEMSEEEIRELQKK